MKAWNFMKSDCGCFVKNKRYQGTGKENITIVQMIMKDEGYKHFAARATFNAWSCLRITVNSPTVRLTDV